MAPGVISAARARRACLVVLGTARPFLRPAAGGPLSSKNGPAFDAVGARETKHRSAAASRNITRSRALEPPSVLPRRLFSHGPKVLA